MEGVPERPPLAEQAAKFPWELLGAQLKSSTVQVSLGISTQLPSRGAACRVCSVQERRLPAPPSAADMRSTLWGSCTVSPELRQSKHSVRETEKLQGLGRNRERAG